VREPIHGTYRGYDIYGPPPPSSGGICLVEMLNILECFSLRDGFQASEGMDGPAPWPPRRCTWSSRRCGEHIATAPAGWAMATSYRFPRISPPKTMPASWLLHRHVPGDSERNAGDRYPLAAESKETTHFSVVDSAGMAVSNTYTLEESYGSRVVVRGGGFLLNNEMTDFNRIPGRTDRKGAIGTPANLIVPGKRMLSSQTPTMVFGHGRLVLVTGSPGGRTIINTVLCTILNTVDFGMDIRRAVDAPRLHHQWFPDRVNFEGAKRPEQKAIVDQLKALGHQFNNKTDPQGDAHSIWIDPGSRHYFGAADHRIGGKAAGY